ncbi:MAG TPA: C25 family cysteine peptidase [Myxococcota bacterium]|nr:C25 family cysteine peptidase [Myxococcota bacterium]HQK51836.1 C25 family cysteine peptidase [Myxococcota bacterium]
MRVFVGILWGAMVLPAWAAPCLAGPEGPESSPAGGRLVWMPREVLPAVGPPREAGNGPIEVRTWTRRKRPWHRLGRPEAPKDLGSLGSGRVWWVPWGTDVASGALVTTPRASLRSPWGARLVRQGLLEAQAPVQEVPERQVILAEDGLLPALDPLVDLRRRQGYEVDVVPVSSVGAHEAAIQAWLRSLARSEVPPMGVLLVGDAPGLPPARTADGSASDWLLALPEDGAWVAAFPVSRLPARNADDVSVMVARIRAWEQEVASGPSGQWTARSVLVSSSEGAGGLDDDQVSDLLALLLLGVDQERPDRLFRSLGTDQPDRLIQALDEGRGLVAYLGHGNGTSWATMEPPFDREAAATLANVGRTPLVLDVSCANGRFDLDECLAETLLHLGSPEAPAGAVAVVSATGDTPWDEPADLARRILLAMTSPGRPRFGEALEQARVALVADRGPTPEVREVLEKTVLLGDLGTPFRSRAPSTMEVQAPDRAVPGEAWTVRVRQGAWPLPGTTLGVVSPGGLPERRTCDAEGKASVLVRAEAGSLAWSAWGPDRAPLEGTVSLDADPCGVLEVDPPVLPCLGAVLLRLWGWSEPVPPVVTARGDGGDWFVTMVPGEEGEWTGVLALGPGAFDSSGPIRLAPMGCPGSEQEFPRDCEAPRVIGTQWRMLDARRVEWTVTLDEPAAGEAGVGPAPGVETRRRRDHGTWLRFVFGDLEPGPEAFVTLRLRDRAGNQRLVVGPEWSFRTPPCTPDCTGRTCGDDGCGGTCGPGCEAGQSCREGRCSGGAGCAWWYLPGSGARCEDCVCQGAPYCCTDRWDDACSWRCEALCGGCGTGCVPECEGRECGDNGCGGTCGGCPPGQTCSPEGRCLPGCLRDCGERECGDDGCGGACGLCRDPLSGEFRDLGCREGRCVEAPRPEPRDWTPGGVRLLGALAWAEDRVPRPSGADVPGQADPGVAPVDSRDGEALPGDVLSWEADEGSGADETGDFGGRGTSRGCHGGRVGSPGGMAWIGAWWLIRRRRAR